MRRIKNYEVTSKEWLIIAFLKSKSSINELFNNNLDNNRSDIKRIINRLRDILPRRLRKAVKKIFMNQKIRKIFQNRIKIIFSNQQDLLIKREEYRYHDLDDPDYYAIRGIENLFDMVGKEDEDYYKPILVHTSFKKYINIMKAEETEIRIYLLKDILIRLDHIYI